ncbi:MAG: NAD-dependent epimerase/dehydratase family protein [Telluria sp.]
MTIAFLGASSKIAKDLAVSMCAAGRSGLLLYVRDVARTEAWAAAAGIAAQVRIFDYARYGELPHDAVINFVGIGDPVKTAELGAQIFDITNQYDELALAGLRAHPQRRYIFLSSGAAYGSTFEAPADAHTPARVPINALHPQDFYGVAKLYAECRHRALPQFAITDIRVFNYFSRTQDIEARFFITDILRAIRDKTVLRTAPGYMVRDFVHPSDFHRLVECILAAPPGNRAVDCYSKAPVDKPALLQAMQEKFGLQVEVSEAPATTVAATGAKPHYYSVNHAAAAWGYEPRYTSLESILLEAQHVVPAQAGTDGHPNSQ